MIKGTGVSAGIGYAQAMLWQAPVTSEYIPRKCAAPALEVDRFEAARRALHGKTRDLRKKAARIVGDDDAAIFDAYSMILDDEEGLLEPLRKKIRNRHYSAEYAVTTQFAELAREFLLLKDEYMRQRVDDVFSIRDQLMRELVGQHPGEAVRLMRPSIIIAKMLGPGEIASLDLSRVDGIICEAGGYSSHSAIIARNLGIPAVLAAEDITGLVHNGDLIAMDGTTGEIWLAPTEAHIEVLRARSIDLAERTRAALTFRGRPTISADGHRVELAAGISQMEDIPGALDSDAESVGLYRTELLFNHFNNPPGEDEQFDIYCEMLRKMGGKSVTVRTYDDGGSPSPLKKKPEANPVLGYRGIRMSLGRPSMFRTQLRALLRASAFGPLRILFPMVSTLDELEEALHALALIKKELRREEIAFDEDIPVGVYITIPSAAMLAGAMAPLVNFITIGINDLIQFSLAIDRGNPDLKGLYHLYHPAILRLLQTTVKAAHKHNIPCMLSGEPPGYEDVLPLLLGIGFDGFIQGPGMILRSRQIVSLCRYEEAKKKARSLLALQSSNELARQLTHTGELTVKIPAGE